MNANIISGVYKFDQPITLVIRPTHGGKIIFHNDQETKSLMDTRNELWGSDCKTAKQITIGRSLDTLRSKLLKFVCDADAII